MFSNLKARILKYCELSWKDLTLLKAWSKRSASFSTFDVESFSSPTLRVASATNEAGEPVVYCPIESCFMVRSFAVSPSASPEEARAAGDLIDSTLEREAQRAGVSKLLIVIPADHPALKENTWDDFQEVRVFERKFNQLGNSGGIALSKPQATQQFLN